MSKTKRKNWSGLSAFSGFTIVETLVAIAILLISLATPLSMAEKGLAGAEASRHEITAFYLAQEAIEYLRNIRDSNAIAKRKNGPTWLQGLNKCLQGEGCGIDVTAVPDEQVIDCKPANFDCALYEYRGSTPELRGIFGHRNSSGWEKTDLTRKIFVEEIENDVEAKVIVVLTWRAGALGFRTITLQEHMFNWYVSPEEEL